MNTPQTYGTGRYTSKYPFMAMKIGEMFRFNRVMYPNLARTAFKYAARVRERTGEPFHFKAETYDEGDSRTTTVTRVE